MKTGKLKMQKEEQIQNVNYESEGDDAKMTFPAPTHQEEFNSRNQQYSNKKNSSKKKTIDLNTNLKHTKSEHKRQQSQKTRNIDVRQADVSEIYEATEESKE